MHEDACHEAQAPTSTSATAIKTGRNRTYAVFGEAGNRHASKKHHSFPTVTFVIYLFICFMKISVIVQSTNVNIFTISVKYEHDGE